jgi:pimeloyl-ACP methyl ester carboxylesterase
MRDSNSTELEAGGLRFTALCAGPDSGTPVLCLHGFPDHNASFRHQLPALKEAGFRGVAPLLRGYEPSSQPDRDVASYHPFRIADDVAAWARELGGGDPVHLLGHDWGAVIGHAVCAQHPELFRSYCAVAVPHFRALEIGVRKHPVQIRNSWYMLFFQLRGIADAALRRGDFAFIERLWRDWSPGWDWDPKDMAALKETFRQPGVAKSALAYYRATLNPFSDDTRKQRESATRPIEVPTLAVTGATDGCIDTRLFDYTPPELFPRGFRLERFQGSGHFVHQEDPEAFNRVWLDWLTAHEPAV